MMPIVQCTKCGTCWDYSKTKKCEWCQAELPNTEYSSEDADDGIFEDKRQKEAEENF